MYCHLSSCVKTTDLFNNCMISTSVTVSFPFNICTRQGYKTSSTIFCIIYRREKCGTGIFITNDIPDILCLMFADDVATCAETASKLQQLNVVD